METDYSNVLTGSKQKPRLKINMPPYCVAGGNVIASEKMCYHYLFTHTLIKLYKETSKSYYSSRENHN